MSKRKVSVIMTVYNGEKYIKESINSILKQTFQDFEFLILNDGSTDNTLKILNSFEDNRVKVINVGKLGRAKGLNYLLGIANGEYIANLDADDLSKPTRLETQVNYLDNNEEVVMVSTGSELIDHNGKILTKSNWNNITVANNLLGKNCPINHSSVMYRLNVAKVAGKYNEDLLKQIDYESWIRFAKEGEIHIIPDILVSKRLHEDQFFEKGGLKYQIHAIKIQKMAIRELGLNKINYLYVILRYIYYIFRINILLDRKIIAKIQEKVLRR